MLEIRVVYLAQRILSRVAERGMPQVVREGDSLRQVLVHAQGAGDSAGYLRHLQRMRQARAVMVPYRTDEDLRFVLEPTERLGMDHPISVALKRRALRRQLFLLWAGSLRR